MKPVMPGPDSIETEQARRQPPLAVARFTTDAYAPADRHEAWSNRDWPAIGPVFDAVPIGPFHNHSERIALGDIAVHYSDMAAQRYDRSGARARRDGVDGLMVELLLAGETAGDAAGRSVRNQTGGMAFNDLAQAHRHVASATRTLLLSIPRAAAERSGLDVRWLHGRHVSAPAAQLVAAQLMAARTISSRLDVEQAGRLGQTILDLLGVALDVEGLRAPAAPPEARDLAITLAARRLIAANLQSSRLTVDNIRRELGLSRARLFRLFEGSGGIQAYIRGQRLEAVRGLLASPDCRDTITDLAHAWGFSDGAHLSRSFRQRFGMAPSDYRAGHTR